MWRIVLSVFQPSDHNRLFRLCTLGYSDHYSMGNTNSKRKLACQVNGSESWLNLWLKLWLFISSLCSVAHTAPRPKPERGCGKEMNAKTRWVKGNLPIRSFSGLPLFLHIQSRTEHPFVSIKSKYNHEA